MPKFKKDTGSPLQKGFTLRSGNKTSFKKMGSSPLDKAGQKKFQNFATRDEFWSNNPRYREPRYLEEMPESDWQDMAADWNQEHYSAENPADLSHLRRTNFERNKRGRLTKQGRKDKKRHEEFLRRSQIDPTPRDLAGDKTKPQLTFDQRRRGYSQVQDPWGYWHVMNSRGQLITGATGSAGLPPESKAWRRKESLNPSYDPSGKDEPLTFVNPNWSDGSNNVENQTKIDDALDNKEDIENITTKSNDDGTSSVDIDFDKTEDVSETPDAGASTFSEAFKNARSRGDVTFKWNGEDFHTRRADETPTEWAEKMGVNIADFPGAQGNVDEENPSLFIDAPGSVKHPDWRMDESFSDYEKRTKGGGGDDTTPTTPPAPSRSDKDTPISIEERGPKEFETASGNELSPKPEPVAENTDKPERAPQTQNPPEDVEPQATIDNIEIETADDDDDDDE